MQKLKLKPAKLFIWDIDNVLYPYDAAFWNMIYEASAAAAVIAFTPKGNPGVEHKTQPTKKATEKAFRGLWF